MTQDVDVLILGAGLQGAGIALELARRGIHSTLVEQDPRALNRASLRNEGKIHLGFIYANDPTRATAFLQLEGAVGFRRIVAGWLGADDGWLARSTPFHYLVAADSIVPAETLAAHYQAVEQRYHELRARDPDLDYLGVRPDALFRPLADAEIGRHFARKRLTSGFATAEYALDTDVLAGAVRDALARCRHVTFLPGHVARRVAACGDSFEAEGERRNGTWRLRARQLVNATWERRAALDRQLGLEPPRQLLHRLKYRVIVRVPERLRGAPSVSMVLGRYGDVVVRTDGTAFLSWYPAGLRGWTNDAEPPSDWDAPCRGEVDPAAGRAIAADILAGIDAWYPGFANSEVLLVDAGAIVAIGATDVDDATSRLHDRTHIGVTSRDGYHSVDPGKLTTAPRFAVEAADRIAALHAGRSRR
jgi:glycine/D-amino acid oxidase-like deaminating enzyme